MLLDPGSIARVLTLRYDPLKRSVRKRLTETDLRPRASRLDNLESRILDLAKKALLHKRSELKFRRVSLSLSGGVDSRLTLALLRTILPEVKVDCIAAGFGDMDDELKQAKEVSSIYDCDFHDLVIDNVLSDLPKLINLVKEPKWNLYHYHVFDFARRHSSNVIFTGDGGDELFGGYTFRYEKFLTLLTKTAGWKTKTKLYLSCHERDWVPDQAKMFGPAVKFSWERIYQLFKSYFDNDLEPLNQLFLADFNGKLLYDWLPTNVAFAKSLEVKIESIFLTDAMIEFAMRLPWQKKYDPQTRIGKLPLRLILVNYKGNEKMRQNAVKKGFSMDLSSLWNKNAREIISAYVNADAEVVRNRIIGNDWLLRNLTALKEDSTQANLRYINKMLSILALEIWYRLFVSKTINHGRRL